MMHSKLTVSLITIGLFTAAGCSGGGDNESPAPVQDISQAGSNGSTLPDTADESPIDDGTSAQAGNQGSDEPPVATTDNGPDMQAPVGNGDDTASIAGFWDLSVDTDAGRDTLYADISTSGGVTGYDYQADATGNGLDCYLIDNAAIAARGDERYDIANSSALPGARSPDDVIILVENGSIVFRYLGDAFDPEFGEGQSGIEERFPAVAGVVPADLTACEDA